MRYINNKLRKFIFLNSGYSGKTPTEEMQVDSIIDLFKDFMLTFRQFFFAVIHGYPEYEKVCKQTN